MICRFCGAAIEPDDLLHAISCDGRQGAREAVDLPSAERPDISGMVHRDDPATSIDAAHVIERKRTELHERVITAFRDHGAMTDEDLELLPEFHGFGPSTIRKRRSELVQARVLVAVGERRNSRNRKMLVWKVAS